MLGLPREWISDWHAKEKPTNSERILGSKGLQTTGSLQLFSVAGTKVCEARSSALLPDHALMQRAGLAVAQLVMAVSPHAKNIWIVCGPGNNGGDGFEAAVHLKAWGKNPIVTEHSSTHPQAIDAVTSRARAVNAGIVFQPHSPDVCDFCIDALFGIGLTRTFDMRSTNLINQMNSLTAQIVSVDIPSGLNADTGAIGEVNLHADFTLSLLTLKPGLFTAGGRDVCGEIWFNGLDAHERCAPVAEVNRPPRLLEREHDTHKGTYGDIGIVGGERGMVGAAMLAAQGALQGGAGRIYLSLLDPDGIQFASAHPEFMFRPISEMHFEAATIVAGCGGGISVTKYLDAIISRSARLVLDADALNCISKSVELQKLLRSRKPRSTVLTPHPLEAARLMGLKSHEVQTNRLAIAQAMAEQFECTVVLKGSGSIVAAPKTIPRINTTGNARLATAGTGDVLAGLIGAHIAICNEIFDATCAAVFQHGNIADTWNSPQALTASGLAQRI